MFKSNYMRIIPTTLLFFLVYSLYTTLIVFCLVGFKTTIILINGYGLKADYFGVIIAVLSFLLYNYCYFTLSEANPSFFHKFNNYILIILLIILTCAITDSILLFCVLYELLILIIFYIFISICNQNRESKKIIKCYFFSLQCCSILTFLCIFNIRIVNEITSFSQLSEVVKMYSVGDYISDWFIGTLFLLFISFF